MLSKCANPGCPAPFLYMHEGKLFRMDTATTETLPSEALPEMKKTARRIEFFWLCNQCAEQVTLSYTKGVGVTVVPLPWAKRVAASAS